MMNKTTTKMVICNVNDEILNILNEFLTKLEKYGFKYLDKDLDATKETIYALGFIKGIISQRRKRIEYNSLGITYDEIIESIDQIKPIF